MCDHCGCSAPVAGHGHTHDHDHRVLQVHESLLSQNDRLAERNRGFFAAQHLAVLNLVSSPGSGKTALLERTLRDIGSDVPCGVIVGDLATENDANRLRQHGAPAVQITTGTVCHLDAHMVQHALEELDTAKLSVVFIENVGNLVCPASFDLGEDKRVVVISVTEGEDKPLKYPSIFQNADLVLLNKIDLAAAVDFNRSLALVNIRNAAPGAQILEVSAKTGAGMDAWYAYIRDLSAAKRKAR